MTGVCIDPQTRMEQRQPKSAGDGHQKDDNQMIKSRHLNALILGLLLVAAVSWSCGGLMPDASTRTFKAADLAGTYTYTYQGTTTTVSLQANGTFQITNSAAYTCKHGSWTLTGSDITLDCQGKYSIHGWYVIDEFSGVGFRIMGGEGDPDSWQGLGRQSRSLPPK